MKILQTLLVLVLFAGHLQAQIGAKVQQGKIYGTWVSNESGEQMKLILNPDGTGELDEEAIRFSTQANKLIVTVEGISTTYNFAMQGNTLTVSDGDLDEPITFTRNGTSQHSGASAKSSPAAAVANNLIGTWSNYGETITFKESGECIYLGQTYPYSVSGNNIIIPTNQGDLVMPYVVNAGQLTLTVNSQNFTYSKGKSNVPASTAKPAGSGNLDLTIIGKWCYINVTSTNSGGSSTDECITINGDGTYSYYSERSMSANTATFSAGTASQNSDAGTWWVAAGRLHYNSQSQGQGSYQLIKRNHPKTGDPMIVLDGTSYVTYFQKSPW